MTSSYEQPATRPTAGWLATWRRDVNSAAETLMAEFEDRFGYRPGRNSADGPSPEGLAAAGQLAEQSRVAAALPHFYQHIQDVVLEDVGNAYFIHPATHVRRDLADSGPIPLGEPGPGAVFASDGGGVHFAIAADGTIHRSATAGREADFHPIAVDLQDFLEQLQRAVIRFVETGQPGDL